MKQPDLLLVSPGGRSTIYQKLADDLASVQPPTWAGLLAEFVRRKGYSVVVLDADADDLSASDVGDRAADLDPRLVAIVCYGAQPSASTQVMPGAIAACREIGEHSPGLPVVMVGGHVAALPEQTLRESGADYCCTGTGEHTILDLLEGKDKPRGAVGWSGDSIWRTAAAPAVQDLDAEMPGVAWDLLEPLNRYRAHNWHSWGVENRAPYGCCYFSLSCPMNCLRGDTPVNTLYGKKPIKELVEKEKYPIYVYDPLSKAAKIEDCWKIQRYGTNSELIRVHFMDGSHIDCTPDHRFSQIKTTGGRGPEKQREWEIQAGNLRPGDRVRAIREEVNSTGRVSMCVGRHFSRLRAHLVMEYQLGRPLTDKELVHHRDHNPANDYPENLELLGSRKEHLQRHPEIAERMRKENPAKNMTPEWRAKITASQTGLVRSMDSRLRYRMSKLGKKNPNYRHGRRAGVKSRLPIGNHQVSRVVRLKVREDTYCLTTSTGWFFANDVAVHNCSFCCIAQPFRSSGMAANGYRTWKPETAVAQLKLLVERYDCTNVKIADELFVLNRERVLAICDGIIAAGLGERLNVWAYAHVATLRDQALLDRLRQAGFRWLAVGIESASEQIRKNQAKKFSDKELHAAVQRVRDAGIDLLANYIFGLPGDTDETCRATLDQAKDLRAGWANFYSCFPYPGSALYDETIRDHPEQLPPSWSAYSQHSYDCQPLPTETLSSAEVLAWRDRAFHEYFEDEAYLASIAARYGGKARAEVEAMTGYHLPRKLSEQKEQMA